MKLDTIYLSLDTDEAFISHMVQMKHANIFVRFVCPKCFISHMVQMKPKLPKEVIEFLRKIFISHMVQMKQKNEHQRDGWLLSLYPTWFRWNM